MNRALGNIPRSLGSAVHDNFGPPSAAILLAHLQTSVLVLALRLFVTLSSSTTNVVLTEKRINNAKKSFYRAFSSILAKSVASRMKML